MRQGRTVVLRTGKRKVSSIEEGDMSLVYAKMMLELPVPEKAAETPKEQA